MKEEKEDLHRVRVRYCVWDILTHKGIYSLIEFVASEHMRISVRIDNTSSFDCKKFHELEMEQIIKLITLGLVAALRLTHAILPEMNVKKQVHVMYIASWVAHTPEDAIIRLASL